jgi:hypothetical protein
MQVCVCVLFWGGGLVFWGASQPSQAYLAGQQQTLQMSHFDKDRHAETQLWGQTVLGLLRPFMVMTFKMFMAHGLTPIWQSKRVVY